MTWRGSLVRISTHEVESLRKRVAEIQDRRDALEMKLVMLSAETEAEMAHADKDAEVGWFRAGFLQGVKMRRAAIQGDIDATALEEQGARDALTQAYEALKKFEWVAEQALAADVKQAARIESAEMDEMGLRRRTAV